MARGKTHSATLPHPDMESATRIAVNSCHGTLAAFARNPGDKAKNECCALSARAPNPKFFGNNQNTSNPNNQCE